MKLRKILSLCLVAAILMSLLGALQLPSLAAIQDNKCGENLSWELNAQTGVLTISGTGPMYSFDDASGVVVPWASQRDQIRTVIVEEGVASIGNCAFMHCNQLIEVTLPDSLLDIGSCAFMWCESLKDVTIPDSVTQIGQSAFSYCAGLENALIGNGVTHIFHVNANLIFATGIKFHFEQRVSVANLKRAIASHRKLTFIGILCRVNLKL
jgi:hypothetical protein